MFLKRLFYSASIAVAPLFLFLPFSFAQDGLSNEAQGILASFDDMSVIMRAYSAHPVDKDEILIDEQKWFHRAVFIIHSLMKNMKIDEDDLKKEYSQRLDVLLFRATSISQISTEWIDESFPLFSEGEFVAYMVNTYPKLGQLILDTIYLVKFIDEEIERGATPITKMEAPLCKQSLENLKEKHRPLFEELRVIHNENMRKGGGEFSEFILEE